MIHILVRLDGAQQQNSQQYNNQTIAWPSSSISMKNSEKQHQLKIAAVDFVITPLHITIKAADAHQYFVQFDKGAQILKKFDETISTSAEKARYSFSSGQHGKFKLQTERSCTCEWGLYRTSSNQMSEFVDSLPVSLLEHYTAFANSLKAVQAEYLKLLSERAQGRQVGKQWEALKERCHWEFPALTARNKNGSIDLQYRLEIHCEADHWASAEKRKSTRSLRSIRSNDKQLNGSFGKDHHEEDDLLPKNLVLSPPEPILPREHKIEAKEETMQQTSEGYRINKAPPVIEPQSLYKKGSELSDIIECSVECSSNMNEKEKRNELKEISGIPEEESELYSPHLSALGNTKTQNFQAMIDKPGEEVRRSNTFDSNYNELPDELDKRLADNKRTSLPERHYNRDEELGKEEELMEAETTPQSEIAPTVSQKEEVKKGRTKFVAIFIICLLFIGVLAVSAYSDQLNANDMQPPHPKKTAKTKRPEQRKKERKGKQ